MEVNVRGDGAVEAEKGVVFAHPWWAATATAAAAAPHAALIQKICVGWWSRWTQVSNSSSRSNSSSLL